MPLTPAAFGPSESKEALLLDERPARATTSVGKALAVLAAFRGDEVLLGLTQVAERASVPKSTAHRLLGIFVEHGFVERAGARYRLSRMMFELGNAVADGGPRMLRSAAAPFLSGLYETTHAAVHLAVLEDLDVLCVDKIYGHGSVQVPFQIGRRRPALCTALGKAILAFAPADLRKRALESPLPRLTPHTQVDPCRLATALGTAARTGIAYAVEGVQLGAWCVAVPILRPGGAVPFGAISLSFPIATRLPANAEGDLRHAAEAIAAMC